MKTTGLFVRVAVLVAFAVNAAAQNRPAVPTPTDVKPGSITCEECPIRIRRRTCR